MTDRSVSVWSLILVLVAGGCGVTAPVEYPAVSGRRTQGATMVADAAFPYRIAAYDVLFAPDPRATRQARRAALLVDLSGGQGVARGFVEWGGPGETPLIYVVGGWARQRAAEGELLTVFDLVLSHLELQRSSGVVPRTPDAAPLAVRVVVHETSGT